MAKQAKLCEHCKTKPATSPRARYCLDCRHELWQERKRREYERSMALRCFHPQH